MQQVVMPRVTPSVSVDQSTSPRLFLSSAGAGWKGLEAFAYVEPNELEGWMTPVLPAVSLVLYRGGGMRIEARHAHGSWSAVSVYEGDVSVRAGWGTPSELRWKRIPNSGGPARTLHLHVSRALLERTAEEAAEYDPARLSVVGRTGIQDPLLTQIGLTLWRELEHLSPASRLYAETAAQLLAVHLLRRYTSAGAPVREVESGRLTPQQVQRVNDFVQAHICQDLCLDDLARQAGFSAYHFARLFRRTTGESPHQFVLRQRIERARALLDRPDMPLAQVALATGFAHQSHLTKHFKRQVGLTPSAYRRERCIRVDSQQLRDNIA
jgi:AraC family transcriptional regulator